MRYSVFTAATFEPLSVAEVKDSPALRITSSDDDLAITRMIATARTMFESYTGSFACAQTIDVYYDEFPGDPLELPMPLTSVTSVKYQDSSDVQQTMTAAYYCVDTLSSPPRLALAYGQTWPTIYDEINSVVIRCVVGYATAAAIPTPIKDGILLAIQELYDGVDRSKFYEWLWYPYRQIYI